MGYAGKREKVSAAHSGLGTLTFGDENGTLSLIATKINNELYGSTELMWAEQFIKAPNETRPKFLC